MSEFADLFVDFAPRMVPVFKKLVQLEKQGVHVTNLLNFMMDSNYDPDWWLTVPVPIVLKMDEGYKFYCIRKVWADERYLVIKYSIFGTRSNNQQCVVVYDSDTGFQKFLPVFRGESFLGCFSPLVCSKNIFLLYFSAKNVKYDGHPYNSYDWRLVYFAPGKKVVQEFESLDLLKKFYTDNNRTVLTANDRKRIIAFIDRVIGLKEEPNADWLTPHRASGRDPHIINIGKIRWKVFEVKDQKGQMVFYIQRTVI